MSMIQCQALHDRRGCFPGVEVEFHIEYEGRLPSQNAKDKDARKEYSLLIRKSFHHQLLRLWIHRFRPFTGLPQEDDSSYKLEKRRYFERKSLEVKGTEFRFFPIINKADHLVCVLDITVYRHKIPGSFMRAGGDMDNHLKVLFDAMSMPNKDQLQGLNLDQIEQPMFCLLEDDALITDVRMRTLQLWTNCSSPQEEHEIKISVDVKVGCTSFQGGYGGVALPSL